MNLLVTGCAGFIGFHTCKRILANKNVKIVGIDSLNNYYSVKIKKKRLKLLKKNKNFIFFKNNLKNEFLLKKIFIKYKIKYVIHLGAQAGVRYSVENPKSYLNNNLISFFNVLNLSKIYKIRHFIFASTSSVYGNPNKFPVRENFNTDHPLSFYAATKKSNEIMAYSYSNMFKLPSTAIRLFTVYGPDGRPDMALFKFTKKILNKEKIELFNNGNHTRDFSYIDDVVEYIARIIKKTPKDKIPFQIFYIGTGKPRKLIDYLKLIEKNLKVKSKVKNLPLQKGDMKKTHSNITKIKNKTNYTPKVNIEDGIKNFVEWYKECYK